MSGVTPFAVIDDSRRLLKVKIVQLNARLPGPDRVLCNRRQFLLITLHLGVPLDTRRIPLTYH